MSEARVLNFEEMRNISAILNAAVFWGWLLVFALAAGEGCAHAYVDPGSGSQILQILIAGLLGALYGLKVFWARIIDFLKKCVKRPKR